LKPTGRIGAAFGSYGWSGEAVKIIGQSLEDMKFGLPEPGIRVKFAPTHEDLAKCRELGEKLGRAVVAGG
jgi:flavorubredoxin